MMLGLTSVAMWIVRASLEAAVLIAAVWAIRAILGRRLPPAWRAMLWLLVALRLTVPLAIESRWSIEQAVSATIERITASRVAAVSPSKNTNASHTTVEYGPVPTGAATDIRKNITLASPNIADAARNTATIVWLAIALTLIARLLFRTRKLRRDTAAFVEIDDLRVLRIASDAQKIAAVPRHVRLVWSDQLRSPAVCGILRPTTLMPSADITAAMSDADLRLMLLHEFAHVRGRDALWSLVASVIAALHWFNPLVWLAARCFREDRELACDARVLRIVGDEHRHAYGQCLLRVVERVSHLRPHPAAVGAFGSFQQLRRRIDMITMFDGSKNVSRQFLAITAVALVGFASLTRGLSLRPEPDTQGERPAATLPNPQSHIAADGGDPSDAEALAALDTVVDEIRIDPGPLSTAIATLQKSSGAKIELDVARLRAERISLDTPMTTILRNVKLQKILDILCDGDKKHLTYTVEGDRIIVTSFAGVRIVPRAYDIRDLLGGGATTQPVDAATRDAYVKSLLTNIKNSVATDSWNDNGGTMGGMQEVGGQIVVTQSLLNQARVAAVLNDFRVQAGIAPQIALTAKLLTMDPAKMPAEVDALFSRSEAKPDAAARPASQSAVIPADRVDEIVQLLAAAHATTITAPRLTTFDRQRATVKIANSADTYISTFTMTRTAGGDRKFEPKLEPVPTGATLDVAASLADDHKRVSIKLRPAVTSLVRMGTEPFAGDPEEKELVVQKPVVETQTMDTTLSMPDGGTCILRWGPGTGKVLLLVVTSKVIVPGGH